MPLVDCKADLAMLIHIDSLFPLCHLTKSFFNRKPLVKDKVLTPISYLNMGILSQPVF